MGHERAAQAEKPDSVIALSMREWLELGQSFTERLVIGPKFFRAFQTEKIEIGRGLFLLADGKRYGPGIYCLQERTGSLSDAKVAG